MQLRFLCKKLSDLSAPFILFAVSGRSLQALNYGLPQTRRKRVEMLLPTNIEVVKCLSCGFLSCVSRLAMDDYNFVQETYVATAAIMDHNGKFTVLHAHLQ